MIEIKENDLFWELYCQKFILNGEEIQKPNNLCQLFWGALSGLVFWLRKVPKLSQLWISTLIGFGITVILVLINQLFKDMASAFIAVLIAICASIVFAATGVVSIDRAFDRLEQRFPKFRTIYAITLLAIATAVCIVDPRYISAAISVFWVCAAIVAISLILLLVSIIFKPDRLEGIALGMKNIWYFLKAKKQGVCPLVSTPEISEKKPNSK